MQTQKVFRSVCALAIGALVFCSCSKGRLAQDDAPEIGQPKEYIVSIGCSGEITDVSISDLTKAEGINDLYAVQVYSVAIGGNGSKVAYAHGLFASLQDVSIKLSEGYKYSFIVTLIKEGQTRLSNPRGKYYNPVTMTSIGAGYPSISPVFIYESGNQYENLGRGAAQIKDADGVPHHPNLDRYYGEVSDYVPTEGGKVTVELKRTVFGLQVITENLTEGSVSVQMDSAPPMTIAYPGTEAEDIFSFYNVKSAWADNNYKESISISFSWIKADGVVVPLVTQTFDFFRNKRTTITLKVEEKGIDNGVGVNAESDPLGDGANYSI